MLGWILQTTIVSILIIFLVHYLISYLKETLTVPKVKDLVNSTTKNYEEIFQTLSNQQTTHSTETVFDDGSTTHIDLLPMTPVVDMKEDLKSFFKEKLLNSNA